jgi:hypothetical protein
VSEIGSYLTAHAIQLAGTDPTGPLDDLEPLADLVGDARVVAVGESAHFLREYTRLRHRVLRFLVERCGFTAFGLESGFSEGRAVDAWVGGGPGELAAIAPTGITNRRATAPSCASSCAGCAPPGCPTSASTSRARRPRRARGTTTTRAPDPDAPGGVAVLDVELGEPEDGSVEALLPGPAIADLRGARGRMPGPDRIRLMDTYQHTAVLDAFDLVAVLDRVSPAERG